MRGEAWPRAPPPPSTPRRMDRCTRKTRKGRKEARSSKQERRRMPSRSTNPRRDNRRRMPAGTARALKSVTAATKTMPAAAVSMPPGRGAGSREAHGGRGCIGCSAPRADPRSAESRGGWYLGTASNVLLPWAHSGALVPLSPSPRWGLFCRPVGVLKRPKAQAWACMPLTCRQSHSPTHDQDIRMHACWWGARPAQA